ncbi:hypothetical protein GCM10010873_37360 [Cypionkella aquatica]|uniref:Peptide methionine sulfoxide reductase n=1 Tax=Cypionkella aquatica TaxID=1756042 RepID=A0AA37TW90_9RHOB|nr:hypothetical protein [Cypionkella aquatica]GLS88762.1 hypothetical protein GCM10010873_37360 [Cypionkella aquatica]
MDRFRAALDLIPEGYSEGLYHGRRWRMEKTTHAAGRSVKFYARDLGGTDFVSLNLYHLASGDVLKPCEMAEAKVRDFILGVGLPSEMP